MEVGKGGGGKGVREGEGRGREGEGGKEGRERGGITYFPDQSCVR